MLSPGTVIIPPTARVHGPPSLCAPAGAYDITSLDAYDCGMVALTWLPVLVAALVTPALRSIPRGTGEGGARGTAGRWVQLPPALRPPAFSPGAASDTRTRTCHAHPPPLLPSASAVPRAFKRLSCVVRRSHARPAPAQASPPRVARPAPQLLPPSAAAAPAASRLLPSSPSMHCNRKS